MPIRRGRVRCDDVGPVARRGHGVEFSSVGCASILALAAGRNDRAGVDVGVQISSVGYSALHGHPWGAHRSADTTECVPRVSEPILSARQLNRAMLARQLLLERSTLPLAEALEQVGGLQTQYAPSGYIGLWSRLDGFRRASLTEALERRRAIQATLMRATIHLVSVDDFRLFAEGTRRARREGWLRFVRTQLDGIDMNAVADRVRVHLADGPRRNEEMLRLLENDGYTRIAWVGIGHWVDLVRVPPSGTWEQRRADLFGLAEDWLDASDTTSGAAEPPTEADGLTHLVRRYLGGFGPAPLVDIANWAGVPVTLLRPVLERLSLRRYRDEAGRALVDLPSAALPDPGTPAPVRFLPTWDATLLAHARRTGILPEEYRPLVFNTKTPHSVPTFLVDGVVAGTWRHEKGTVRLAPFGDLATSVELELRDEAERLAAFHSA